MKIKINNQFLNFFDNLTINLSLDSFASPFSFVTRFNPDNKLHRELFKPLSFNRVQIYNNENKLLLNGVAINHSKKSGRETQLLNISGYSKAGILEDVNIPVSAYPLEKNNVNLNEITDSLIGIFGLKKIVESSAANDMSLNYEKTKAGPTETVKSYLSKLANQRNIIISHNQNGDLVFFKGTANMKPKRAYNETNVLSMDLQVKGQGIHSEISVIRQPSDNNNGVSTVDTVNNNLVSMNRSTVKVLSSGEDTDTSKAANNVLAAELRNISLKIDLHKVDAGLRPGDLISIENKEIFIYKPTKFLITSITINEKSDSETMVLNCLLPEVLTGESPKDVFG
jgi:prophage tail gpP-like protein